MRRLITSLLCLAVWGPGNVWADCSGGSVATGKACSGVSFQGCCDGEKLLFCEAGELCEKNCEASKHCGFSVNKGFYDCGTDGMPDPLESFSMTCPSDPCDGVGYEGCCAGNSVVWCEAGAVKSLDCTTNGTKTLCAASLTAVGAVDCGLPDATPGRACSGQTDLDIVAGDSTASDAVSPPADVVINYDSLVVPDMNSPSECAELGRYWKVTTTTCPGFAEGAQVKEERCVGVWAGLVPTAEWHPYGRVTLSGVQLGFMEAGVKHQCSAQFAGTDLQGQCFWGDSQCVFTMTPSDGPVVVVEEPTDGSKSSGGCATSDTAPSTTGLTVLAALAAALFMVSSRRGRRQ